LWLPKVQLQ
jgi:hypothetical protein